jgi:hypothetical protein
MKNLSVAIADGLKQFAPQIKNRYVYRSPAKYASAVHIEYLARNVPSH